MKNRLYQYSEALKLNVTVSALNFDKTGKFQNAGKVVCNRRASIQFWLLAVYEFILVGNELCYIRVHRIGVENVMILSTVLSVYHQSNQFAG